MINLAPVSKNVVVNAGQAQAFEIFTARMSAWWPATHSILKSPLKECIVEPRVGGRWYSVGEDGSSCQTGYVIAWQPPELLVLAWQLTPEWQFDPNLVTEVEVKFVAVSADTTRIELEHRHIERMGANAVSAHKAIDNSMGWSAILESFKLRAERSGEMQ